MPVFTNRWIVCSNSVCVSIFILQKDDDKTNFSKLISAIKSSKSGATVGEVSKDKFGGDFCESWRKVVSNESFTRKDISAGLAYVMAPKDETELSVVKKACQATCDIYNKYLKTQIIDAIDSEKVSLVF